MFEQTLIGCSPYYTPEGGREGAEGLPSDPPRVVGKVLRRVERQVDGAVEQVRHRQVQDEGKRVVVAGVVKAEPGEKTTCFS